jgi:hypothetical protein
LSAFASPPLPPSFPFRPPVPRSSLAVAGAEDAEPARDVRERLGEPGVRVCSDRPRTAQPAGEVAAGTDLRLATERLLGLLLGAFAQRWPSRSGPLDRAVTDGRADLVPRGPRPRRRPRRWSSGGE